MWGNARIMWSKSYADSRSRCHLSFIHDTFYLASTSYWQLFYTLLVLVHRGRLMALLISSLIISNICLVTWSILDLARLIRWHLGLEAKFVLWSVKVIKGFLSTKTSTLSAIPRLIAICLVIINVWGSMSVF